MRIVIIEDEQPAFNRLQKLVNECIPDAEVIAHLDSIAGCKKWFAENDMPDIVFLDIHLADGSAFDMLEQIKITAPIIFTTAYDQYAVDAFKTSGIGYLLKPIKTEELTDALDKLDNFKKAFSTEKQQAITQQFRNGNYKKRFLIRFGDVIKTISTDEIAYFYSENKGTFARTFEERTYPIDNNLDALDQILDPEHFFRINRQYIISMKSLAEMKSYSKARVVVKLKPEAKEAPIVSSERSSAFKLWLAGEV